MARITSGNTAVYGFVPHTIVRKYRPASRCPTLGVVKLPFLRTAEKPVDDDSIEIEDEVVATRGYTAPKGRETPKRRDAENRRRGPVAPPPMTQREAMRRNRVSKEDRKAAQATRRKNMAEGRELLPRDRGPVRAFVRDIVDSRRHLLGLFMPLALLVLVAMIAPIPKIQVWAAPGTMVILVIMILEGVLLGRTVLKRVRAKFPDAKDGGLALGWYSFVRASQVRKLRIPKPTVQVGDTV